MMTVTAELQQINKVC